MLHNALNLLYGIIFGVANVIPGVSGGTMMVVFGIYDKLVEALSFKLSAIKKNIVFLVFFGAGAAIGVVGFSFVITWLFENFPVGTNMFFMGLIAGSIPLIYRNATAKQKLKPYCLAAFIPALALVVGMTVLDKYCGGDNYALDVQPSSVGYSVEISNNGSYDIKSGWTLKADVGSLESASENCTVRKSSDSETTFTGAEGAVIKAGGSITVEIKGGEITSDSLSFSYTYQMNVMLFITILLGVTVAAVAMIIPGVSGSFVMVLIGIYTTIIGAIKSLDFTILIPTAVGVLVGIVFGAKLISALMKRYSMLVYSAIMGLVIGSLYAVLPEGIGFNFHTLIGVFAFAVGAAIALVTGKYTKVEEEA